MEEYPPLSRSPSLVLDKALHNPTSSPSFNDPSLLKALDIFSDKYPLPPSTRPLESIRFENVTIQKSRKNKTLEATAFSGSLGHYTPLSARLKNVARSHHTS